jgi:hypothetical protein
MSYYWDINIPLSYNALFNFIVSNRGAGKTYGVKKKYIKDFLEKRKEFVYMRRYEKELKKASRNFFKDITANEEFPGVELKFDGGLFKINGEIAGYGIPLSTAKTLKSDAYPKVENLLYDEFIIDKGLIRYIPDEVTSFLEAYETIARPGTNHPIVKAFFLANAITWTNPYFLEFDIQPPRNKIGIQCKNDILIQLVQNQEFKDAKKETRFGKIIKNTRYADYSIDNVFLRDNNDFVIPQPQKLQYFFTMKAAGEYYGIWISYDEGLMYVSKKYDPSYKVIFTTILDNHKPNTMLLKGGKKSVVFQSFTNAFKMGNVFFDSIGTKNIVLETIKNTL